MSRDSGCENASQCGRRWVSFDPEQSRAKEKKKKRASGSPGAVLQDFLSQEQALPPVRSPSSNTGLLGIGCFLYGLGSRVRPLVLKVPLWLLSLPSLPIAVPCRTERTLSFLRSACHLDFSQPHAASLALRMWLMGRSTEAKREGIEILRESSTESDRLGNGLAPPFRPRGNCR